MKKLILLLIAILEVSMAFGFGNFYFVRFSSEYKHIFTRNNDDNAFDNEYFKPFFADDVYCDVISPTYWESDEISIGKNGLYFSPSFQFYSRKEQVVTFLSYTVKIPALNFEQHFEKNIDIKINQINEYYPNFFRKAICWNNDYLSIDEIKKPKDFIKFEKTNGSPLEIELYVLKDGKEYVLHYRFKMKYEKRFSWACE